MTSITMATVPNRLYTSNFPLVPLRVTSTALGVGAAPGVGFRLAVSGTGAASGKRRMLVCSVASTAVTLTARPAVPVGSVQSPVVPQPSKLRELSAPMTSGRVSASRHGSIGKNAATGPSPESPVAETNPKLPPPRVTATAAPTAAHRVRSVDMTSLPSPTEDPSVARSIDPRGRFPRHHGARRGAQART